MRIALALLLCFPAIAAEPVKPPDTVCNGQWCAIKQDTLKQLLEGLQALQTHNVYIETLCNWRQP